MNSTEQPNTTPTKASCASDSSGRLFKAAQMLLADGLLPGDIEMHVYRGLTASTPRASLFRAGIGIEAPLTRDKASRIAEAIGRALRGPRDDEFVHQYGLAHARGRMMQGAHDAAEDLRQRDIPVTRDNLELELMMAVRCGRGGLIVDNAAIANDSIEKRIKFCANDYLGGVE
jgi:hypothetical protein